MPNQNYGSQPQSQLPWNRFQHPSQQQQQSSGPRRWGSGSSDPARTQENLMNYGHPEGGSFQQWYGLSGFPRYWDQQGQWSDPVGYGHDEHFLPHIFTADLVNSPQARAYQDVEGTAQTMGVEGIRQGEAAAITQGQQAAASQGLGRGFAAQQEADIRQQGTMGASSAMMQGALEEKSRRWEMATMMAQSLIETNRAGFARYLQNKQLDAAEDAAGDALLGGLIGGIGSITGGAIAAFA